MNINRIKKRILTVTCVFKILILCVLPNAYAAEALANDSWSAYEVPRSIVRSITSKQDRTYELYIKFPPGFHSQKNRERRYPVVYLNDGTYCFQTAAGVTHLPMGQGAFEHAILVGISYSIGDKGKASRSRDLTPTVPKKSEGHGAQYPHGQAAQYLAFLTKRVVPLIEEEYRGDPNRRILVGQSYGGLFGAYVLLTNPTAFNDYLLTSTSFWHNENVLFDLEKKFAASNNEMPARVYFAVGSREHESTNNLYMITNQKRFVDIIKSRDYVGLEVREEVIEDASHYTTFPIGLTRGLSWFLKI